MRRRWLLPSSRRLDLASGSAPGIGWRAPATHAPPASHVHEFRDITRAGPSLAVSRPEFLREINAELEKLRPELDAFPRNSTDRRPMFGRVRGHPQTGAASETRRHATA